MARDMKKGCRVKLIDAKGGIGDLVIGDTGTLAENNDDGVPYVNWDRTGEKYAVFEQDIELAPKFAVGDRVRNALHGDDYDSNGTITAINGDTYIIKWDSPHLSAHGDLNWRDRDLELAVAPQQQLTIQAGRYYKTRDGRRVGPMAKREIVFSEYTWKTVGGRFIYKDSGENYVPGANDLIAKWPADSYTSCAAAEVDNMRDEYGPFGESVAVASNDYGTPKFKVGDYITKSGWNSDGYRVTKLTDSQVYVDSGTGTGYEARYDVDDDWIVVTSAPEPDATLSIKYTSDFSELDAEIDRVKRRLKKLAKRARKLGIRLDYDLAA